MNYYKLITFDFDVLWFETVDDAERWCNEHSDESRYATLETETFARLLGVVPYIYRIWVDGEFRTREYVDNVCYTNVF